MMMVCAHFSAREDVAGRSNQSEQWQKRVLSPIRSPTPDIVTCGSNRREMRCDNLDMFLGIQASEYSTRV